MDALLFFLLFLSRQQSGLEVRLLKNPLPLQMVVGLRELYLEQEEDDRVDDYDQKVRPEGDPQIGVVGRGQADELAILLEWF